MSSKRKCVAVYVLLLWYCRALAVHVRSGIMPGACCRLAVFQAVRITPFAALIKCPQLAFRYVASLQQVITVGFPGETRRDLALAVWGIHPSDSHALFVGEFGPWLNPTA